MRSSLSRVAALIGPIAIASHSLALPAFPGAEGFGADATGGRGTPASGEVMIVKSLCDWAEGAYAASCGTVNSNNTLRGAITKVRNGPRTIVFEVGGEIILKRQLVIDTSNITIAGQSAPWPGITIRPLSTHVGMTPLFIRAENIVLRHLRFRGGASKGQWDTHAVAIEQKNASPFPKNIILDHISASWSTDDLISIQDAQNVTVQWSILSESLQLSDATLDGLSAQLALDGKCASGGFPDGDEYPCTTIHRNDGKGMLFDSNPGTHYTGKLSIHHNLFAHHAKRMPQGSAGALAGQPDQEWPVEIVNNVMHDYSQWAVMLFDGDCGLGTPSTCSPPLSCSCSAAGRADIKRKLRANLIGNTLSLSEETLEDEAFDVSASYGDWLPSSPYGAKNPWIPRDLMYEFMNADPSLGLPAQSEGLEIYLDDNLSYRRDYDDEDKDELEEDDQGALPLCTHGVAKYTKVINCDPETYSETTAHASTLEPDAREVALAAVLADAGAHHRDEVDDRAVEHATEHTGTFQTVPNPALDPVSSTSRLAGWDDDLDGIEDDWEDDFGGLAPQGDADLDGYTNLEEYLNGTEPAPIVIATQANQNDGDIREWYNDEYGDVNKVDNQGDYRVGDDNTSQRPQWRSILSFDTGDLADDAVIVAAKLTLHQTVTGGSPASLGDLVADIKTGTFGNAQLEASDWEAAATENAVVTLTDVGGGVFSGSIDEEYLDAINPTGLTQMRVRFLIDDDNDGEKDYRDFSEGNPAKLTLHVE
jgi:pectate lyase